MPWTDNGLDNSIQQNYHFYYLDSLATAEFNNIEPSRTFQAMFASAMDFSAMQDWFGGTTLGDTNFPITVNVGKFSNNAFWSLNSSHALVITLNPGAGDHWMVRYLLVAEMVEQFMRNLNGGGWYGDADSSGSTNEGSMGEGLSQFLSAQFLLEWGTSAFDHIGQVPAPNFEYSNKWLASNRIDWVNNPDLHDASSNEKSGCALLFIYYLHDQLNFSIKDIIAAGPKPGQTKNLTTVYHNLTGNTDDPFPAFKSLLDKHFPLNGFPANFVITSGNRDNPFPLPAS